MSHLDHSDMRAITIRAIRLGLTARPCYCDAHVVGRCNNTECCCLRHYQEECSGYIKLDRCALCNEIDYEKPTVILDCGCIHCTPCACTILVAKPWSNDMELAELATFITVETEQQHERVLGLLASARSKL